VANGSETEFC